MIITRLIGGIGNQMFEYAAGRAVAERTGQELKLDISAYKYDAKRQYSLSCFNTIENFLDVKNYFRAKQYNEQHFHFDPDLLKTSGNIYMNGYWQSEKYFKDIEDIIRKDFTFKEFVKPKNDSVKSEIQMHHNNSISIHVRRGDYVSNPQTNEYHGVLPIKYYEKAASIITDKIKDPYFFIFSDDINWCKSNFKLDYPTRFVEGNRDWEDMQLMVYCKNHIIANSAFSWWGAWLSPFKEKIVISPKDWFAGADLDIKDLIPERWIRL